eukprot:968771-Rhodomonas_salina.3
MPKGNPGPPRVCGACYPVRRRLATLRWPRMRGYGQLAHRHSKAASASILLPRLEAQAPWWFLADAV